MAKTVVEFLRTWGKYVKGDTAGFDADRAEALCGSKPPIAKMVGEAKSKRGATAKAEVGMSDAAKAAIDEAKANAEAKAKALDEREAELAKREAALAEKEAKVTKAEAGAPPKQGAKK